MILNRLADALPTADSPGQPIILLGVESNFTPEYLETARRTGSIVVAAVITGAPEWDLDELPLEASDTLPAHLTTVPVAIPWVTPGLRSIRRRQALNAGFSRQVSLIDPGAIIAASANLGEGLFVNAGVTIGACAQLADGVLINRNASVGHHARLDRFVSLGPGVTVASECQIGRGVMIGAGAVVAPKIEVGENSVLAVGAVVAKHVPAHCVVAGNPARIVRRDIAGYKDVSVD